MNIHNSTYLITISLILVFAGCEYVDENNQAGCNTIDDFQINCSENYETYKAPNGYVSTFRKTRVSAYDKKKEVWIRTVDTRGREINYFYPVRGRTYFIAVDFFNYDYFNTGKDYKLHRGRNCSSSSSSGSSSGDSGG